MKRTLMTTAAICAALLLATGANAADKYFYHTQGTPQAWTSANWYTAPDGGGSSTTKPGTSDRAIIEADCFMSTSEEAESIEVEVGQELDIRTNQTLTLNNGSSEDSVIAGTLDLEASGSELEFTTNNHQISGAGKIDGSSDSARLRISSAITVTVSQHTSVTGAMEIRAGSGTLDNDGTVEADNAGAGNSTLTCFDGTFAGSGEYKVSTVGATMQFSSGISDTGMAADFTMTAGTLDVNEEVVTTGEYSQTGGTLDVVAGKKFQAS